MCGGYPPLWTIRLPGTVVDVSSDGWHVLLINKDNNQLQIYDRNRRTALPVVEDRKMGAISPDGGLVVAQVGQRVKVVREGKVVFEEDGTLPSWIDESTISFFAPEDYSYLIALPSKNRRTLSVVGRPFVSLQRSAGGALMYVTRTRADFWSADLSCPERYRVIVHEREQEPGFLFAVGCKGSPSTSIRWVNNANVCSNEIRQGIKVRPVIGSSEASQEHSPGCWRQARVVTRWHAACPTPSSGRSRVAPGTIRRPQRWIRSGLCLAADH